MQYVYVLWSGTLKQMYTGCTNDLKLRINLHNHGTEVATKKVIPWQLIYYEAGLNKYDGFRRERYLKTGPGKRFLKNRLRSFLKA